MHKKLTILTTTHYKASAHRLCKDYPANHDRKVTDTNLIESTINDLYEKLGSNNFRHLICLDHDVKDDGSVEYYNNLHKLLDKYNNLSILITTAGIYHSIKSLILTCKTPYYLFWEHDWQFVDNFDIEHLIDAFDQNEDINYVRFNKRRNITAVGDTILRETKYKNPPLLQTNCWSNNPYLGRKSKMLEWYKMMDESTDKFHPTIELFLQQKMRRDGNNWGVYIYGNLNDPPRVKHMNGRDK